MSGLLAKFQQARLLQQQGRFSLAQVACEKILKSHATHLDTLLLSAQIAGQTGDLERAVRLLDKAVVLAPGQASAWCNRGLALQGLGRLDAALDSYERALGLQQDYAIAHFNHANLLNQLGRADEALHAYERAVAAKADFAPAHYNRGVLLLQRSELDAAAASFGRAIASDARYAEAYYNRGVVQQRREQWTEALVDYDRAIALRPGYAEAHCNRGVVLQRLERLDDALAAYGHAIALRDGYAEAYSNRGIVLHRQRRLAQALASFEQAIALNGGFANAYANRGHVLRELKQWAAAIESYERAAALGSDSTGLLGMRRHAQLQICDWTAFDAGLDDMAGEIERGVPAAPPFHLLVASDSPRLQCRGAAAWARVENPPSSALAPIPARNRPPKLKLAYFSADFRNHPTSHLIAELFELHDRQSVELTAFSFGPDSTDPLRQRVAAACHRFVDVRDRSDQEVAELARQLEIDVAIDLMGFTQFCRPGIFALRAAPVQVSYLGYPGTMGVPYMDYLVADRIVIPEDCEADYWEKIIRLPHSYQVNDRKRSIAEPMFTREQLGLPRAGFVFCCFNNSCKITPSVFDRWMHILQRSPGSVLWLLEDNPAASRNLRQAAKRHGLPADRLIFGERMPAPQHLARHRLADLFLDTSPYNAHTTASDALWAGLPVLTWAGTTFAGRVAASLLTAVNLPELIAASPDEYEELAVQLAADPLRLGELRSSLMEQRLRAPLFDTPRFVQHWERALHMIHERQAAGLPPEHTWV